ncbi:NUDIX hydrolase [Candidatus Uhrbacteria bacterium]|jgi:ADP-ribose pyrophosphatase|nr:NUDIX hydrolase [Candidatus Uhrbacteria bacterium]
MAKIPEQAKLIFEGVIFDVYQWEQEMFDGTKDTFEGLRRQNTAEVIATVGDKIMIQDQEQPAKPRFMCLPGGRIEKGEDELVGAKRELLEESGYASDGWELHNVTEPNSKIDWKIFIYIARDCKKIQEMNLDAGEKIEIKWVTLDGLIEMVSSGELSHVDHHLMLELLRAKYDSDARDKLQKLIFG